MLISHQKKQECYTHMFTCTLRFWSVMCTTSLHLSSATYIACTVANCNRGWTSLTYSWRSSFIHWVTLLVSTHTCNRKQQSDLLRREWWCYVKQNMIGEWPNSNLRALLRDAGAVYYKRSQVLSVGTGKPRKLSVNLHLRIKPWSSQLIITTKRLAVKFVSEITRHKLDAISEMYTVHYSLLRNDNNSFLKR
jgi:hypothetical protein